MDRPTAYAVATVVVALCTGLDWLLRDAVAESDLVMIFVVGVLLVARLFEVGPALWAAVCSVAAFDVLFVEPRFTFAVTENRYLITFAVMGVTGVVVATTTGRLRAEARRARQRAQRLEVLYDFSRDLVSAEEDGDLDRLAIRRLDQSLGIDARIVRPGEPPPATPAEIDLPLRVGEEDFGALRVDGRQLESRTVATHETLSALAQQLTLARHRARLAVARRQAEVEVDRERVRNSLLSSVSHDLRTPLGSIIGAASTLSTSERMQDEDRSVLLQTIHDEASRLSRLLDNLLQMTRIEGGAMRVRKELEVPEELVGAVLARFGERLRGRDVRVSIDEEPALVPFDPLLLELVLGNIVDNAIAHGHPEGAMSIRGHAVGRYYRFVVEDDGPGVGPGELEHIFEKFRQGETSRGGAGLGLAICRAIVDAHGGSIVARSRGERPGLAVIVELPLDAEALPATQTHDLEVTGDDQR